METKNTKIYMIVDTKSIQPGRVDDFVEFKDNRSNPNPKRDPENFTSQINAGEKVMWFGEPKEENREVIEITSVKRKGEGPKLVKDFGNDPQHPGAYMARVVDEYIRGEESYSISFRIRGHKAEYEVDPKLEMVPTSR